MDSVNTYWVSTLYELMRNMETNRTDRKMIHFLINLFCWGNIGNNHMLGYSSAMEKM